ncbi:MAG: bifunctional lysylphosphatidylglycerol synthetase/lysine--tRNA ligase LysX [Mycobacteriaceae bacterium]
MLANSEGATLPQLPPCRPQKTKSFTTIFATVPHYAGLALGIYSVLNLMSSLSPVFRHITGTPRTYIDTYFFDAPDTSFAWTFVLALFAAAISSRKRIAYWILLAYLLILAEFNINSFINTNSPHRIIGLTFQLTVLIILISSYKQFTTKVRRGALFKAFASLLTASTIGTIFGWLLIEIFPGTVPSDQRFVYSLNRVAFLVAFDNEQFDGRTHGFINTALGLFGALALIGSSIVLFRSQRSANALTGDDESALRGLLKHYGTEDSLGYFATRRDKCVVFSENGKAAITYRVEIGVCIASGDPIGDSSSWPQAITVWLALAATYGWTPAVMGASEKGAKAFSQAGLNALELGDEAVVRTRNFNLNGHDMRGVRQAVNRARKAGISIRIRRHNELQPEEMAKIISAADDWRDTETERGFSMALGRLGDPVDGDCLLVEALTKTEDGSTQLQGFLSLVPWGETGVSLDLMRRNPQSANGTVELMISDLITSATEHSITQVSLNFAVFRSVFEDGARIGAGPILRVWRSFLLFFSRWWQLEALYRSNVKYRPEWVPRYLCFDDSRLLPRVGIASAIAEGFIILPKLSSKRGRKHTGLRAAVPQVVIDSGILHSDGSAPDQEIPDFSLPIVRRPDQVSVRIDKLKILQNKGIDPYPIAYPPTHTIIQALSSPTGTRVRITGRILRIRNFGGVIFVQLSDWSDDIQLLFDRQYLDPSRITAFSSTFDLGDLIETTGTLGYSRSGQKSLIIDDWRMIGKCLHPLPEKWKGLQDPEARVRQRYLDLVVNKDSRELTIARSLITKSLRESLSAKDFIEVETPILQPVHGGANATPFNTHINAYNLDLYLRIAPELYLKRLCVGGMEKVFELGRTFRNEGVDFKHNPEFTILEAYEAHSDYQRMLTTCRELIQKAAIVVHGKEIAMQPDANGYLEAIDISGQWPVKTFYEAISEATGENLTPESSQQELRKLCIKNNISFLPQWDSGHIALELYERLVEAQTKEPTFYIDFPTSVSPLTRAHRSTQGVCERWDLVAFGIELGTAYSELTDPLEQRKRLTEQSLRAAGGDQEAMELDEDFLQALEYAMPPTGGLGLGVDRVVMLITGRSICETLAFPLTKPQH